MKIILILSSIAIAIGFFTYPPLYLLCRKYKWIKKTKELIVDFLLWNILPLSFCLITLYISYDTMEPKEHLLYNPDWVSILSTLLASTITFLWVEVLFKKDTKNNTEYKYQETGSIFIVLGTIALAIPITYYIFQWCLVTN